MSLLDELENESLVEDALNSDNENFEDTIAGNVIASQRKKLKKRSAAWQHFDEISEGDLRYAKCKLCIDKATKYLLSGGGNSGTGNMTRHIEKEHAGEVVIGAFDKKESVFVFSQETFRKALIKWIVVSNSNQPFTEPQQKSFVELVNTLNPNAKLISDKTVRADVIDTYLEKFEEVKEMLAKIPGKLSISHDGWTSRNMLPFLAIRGHWLDNEWKYHSVLLDFSFIAGKHSAWKHSNIFRDCLARLDFPITKILGVTSDNAACNDTFFQWLEEHGLSPQ